MHSPVQHGENHTVPVYQNGVLVCLELLTTVTTFPVYQSEVLVCLESLLQSKLNYLYTRMKFNC
jgi:hypothetical protein